MRDIFDYRAPFSLLGRAADVLFLESHMRNFLIERNRCIKQTAESDAWTSYLAGMSRAAVGERP